MQTIFINIEPIDALYFCKVCFRELNPSFKGFLFGFGFHFFLVAANFTKDY